jgi:hypothetical protein
MRKKEVQRFLWPQKAEGRPVMMRMAPSTPNAGSTFVARTMGAGVGEWEAEADWRVAEEDTEEEAVVVEVRVTLETTGITVMI